MPEVLGDFGEEPIVSSVNADAPSKIVVEVLIEGDGEEIEEGSSVTVNYAGYLWDGTEFDGNFGSEATTFSLENLIQGWQLGLPGVTVGSRVLLVIPPEYGYGSTARSNIPANSDLIFVIDILESEAN